MNNATLTNKDFSLVQQQLAQNQQVIDIHLARITRLQMLIELEESRLLEFQEKERQLLALLDN